MVECKVIKRDEIPKNNMPDIIEKTLENIKGVDDIASSVFMCPESDTNIIVDIKECNQVIHITGKWEVGPAYYIQIIRITKAVIELLICRNSKAARKLLAAYEKNGIRRIGQPDASIRMWCDHIDKPNAVIVATIGNILVPFSLSDYLFEKSNEAEQFHQLVRQYHIPAVFGRIYPSVDAIKEQVERSEKAFAFDNGMDYEVKVNQCLMMLWPTKENERLIFLIGLKERYRQSDEQLRLRMQEVKDIVSSALKE